jgi:hypothetical protein
MWSNRPFERRGRLVGVVAGLTLSLLNPLAASDRLNVLDYSDAGLPVDRTGMIDASKALARAISAANARTRQGEASCVYLPAGVYLIATSPPAFERAGCIIGDGSSQSAIKVSPNLSGDLFAWTEAWIVTTPGPRVVGLRILGDRRATAVQNAFVFYDRNDQVYFEDVDVSNLNGRALYSGVAKQTSQAYMRESHFRSLRFFNDGAPDIPVIEFTSQGKGKTDATNEIRMSQVDVYGARGPSVVIRNEGDGGVRNVTIDGMRIEGSELQNFSGDLLTIGDPTAKGNVNNLTFTNLELVDPYEKYAALHLTAPSAKLAPYQIVVQGSIGGGIPRGQGLVIDAGRDSMFRLSGIYTFDTNVVVGPGVRGILVDAGGQEAHWTYKIDPTSARAISVPVLRSWPSEGR